jgi:hypothetical protein
MNLQVGLRLVLHFQRSALPVVSLAPSLTHPMRIARAAASMCCVWLCAPSGSAATLSLLSSTSRLKLQHIIASLAR